MDNYSTEYREGNLLWNSHNSSLFICGENPLLSFEDRIVHVAFPIPISEELLLNVLDFTDTHNSSYSKDGIIILINRNHYISVLSCFGKPIVYLNDLQNVCKDNNLCLKIDKNKLIKYCKKIFNLFPPV